MKKRKTKTSTAQLAAWRRWREAHRAEDQARKNAWAKSPAGRAWLAANQKKKNAARKAWRARKRAEEAKTKKRSGTSNAEMSHGSAAKNSQT